MNTKPLSCLTGKAAPGILSRAWPSWSQQEGGVKGRPRLYRGWSFFVSPLAALL